MNSIKKEKGFHRLSLFCFWAIAFLLVCHNLFVDFFNQNIVLSNVLLYQMFTAVVVIVMLDIDTILPNFAHYKAKNGYTVCIFWQVLHCLPTQIYYVWHTIYCAKNENKPQYIVFKVCIYYWQYNILCCRIVTVLQNWTNALSQISSHFVLARWLSHPINHKSEKIRSEAICTA